MLDTASYFRSEQAKKEPIVHGHARSQRHATSAGEQRRLSSLVRVQSKQAGRRFAGHRVSDQRIAHRAPVTHVWLDDGDVWDLRKQWSLPAHHRCPEISSRPVQFPLPAWPVSMVVSTAPVPGPGARAESSLEPAGGLTLHLVLCGIGARGPRILPWPISFRWGSKARSVALF